MDRIAFAALAALLIAAPSFAQSRSPYAGLETRDIKALSEQQISDLRAGLGMSLALAAELNGYPGPRHAVELATDLNLSEEQRTKVEALLATMKAESIAVGEQLIAQESELDREFANKTITPQKLHSLTVEIGRTQGALREIHLKYHLSTLALLTPMQAQRYAQLRGYTGTQQHNPAMHGGQ